MNDLIETYMLQVAGTPALIDEHGSVVLRLLEFVGSRYDQPMAMFKTKVGYRMFYLHISNPENQPSMQVTNWLLKLCELYSDHLDETFALVTWTDVFQGHWITPELKIFYLGSYYLFESRPKYNYHNSTAPAMLCATDHDRLLEYVVRQSDQTNPASTILNAEGYVYRIRIDAHRHIHFPEIPNAPVDMIIVDVHPHCRYITDERLRELILEACDRCGTNSIALKNIYITNYLSTRVLTEPFYTCLSILTETRKPSCQIE